MWTHLMLIIQICQKDKLSCSSVACLVNEVCLFSLTASQAAAQARNPSAQQSAAASSITGMSLQEAQQILNISTLTPEEIQKVRAHTPFHNATVARSLQVFARRFAVCRKESNVCKEGYVHALNH